MTASQQIAERVRAKLARKSDYELAKQLHMHQSNLGKVLKGERHLGEEASMRPAELLHMSFDDIRTLINEESAKTPREREFWKSRSPRITASMAIAAMALGLAVTHGSARASTVWNHSVKVTDLYIMRSLRNWLTFAKSLFARGFATYRRAAAVNGLGAPA